MWTSRCCLWSRPGRSGLTRSSWRWSGQLRAWLPVTAEAMRQDRKLQWAIQHGLLISAEALFDAGAHILAGEYRESTDEYREIPEGCWPVA